VGGDRILVQLPEVDPARAKALIGQTALLEFRLLEENRRTLEVLQAIDRQQRRDLGDTLSPEEAGPLIQMLRSIDGDIGVEEENYLAVEEMFKGAGSPIPQDDEFLFGSLESYKGHKLRRLYLARRQPELTGSALKDARAAPYSGDKPHLMNTWTVNLQLERQEARRFARLTEENVGRRLAIVLDRVVRSAPVIEERIPDGRAMITTGEVNPEKARDLSIVLRSGALPAPIEIAEERSVGPSLGADSIRKGIQAILIGAALVILFMVGYYSLSGLLADFALFLNIFFLLAIMAGLRATLTLPGLAGIALTIGMAVDANILIFERIREELGSGKELRRAVGTGYSRAFVTIVDANITTIITAVILYFFGTGPIRGFATTLIVGLVINIITAVWLTRFILNYFITRYRVQRLRI
jgi:protein-export membrane protein SecD